MPTKTTSRLRLGLMLTVGLVLTAALAGTALSANKPKPKTTRISVKANGKEVPGGNSEYAAISANGRLVSFETSAKLVGKDDAMDFDVYVYNRVTKRNTLISVRSNGQDGTDVDCADSDISPSGRYVSFGCDDPLVGGDQNGIPDVYRHDRKTGKTILISLKGDETQLAGVNDESELSGVANNGVVAFESMGAFVNDDTNGDTDIFVRNPAKGTTKRATLDYQDNELASGGDAGKDSKLAISGENGRFVAFESSEVATADSDYGFAMDSDVFLRDMKEGTTERVSLKSNEEEADDNDNASSRMPSISASGRYVAFQSAAPFVAGDDMPFTYDIYVRDRKNGRTFWATLKSNGEAATPAGLSNQYEELSANGRYLVWDTGANYGGGPDPVDGRDVYRRDLENEKTKLVSVTFKGLRGDDNQIADVSNSGWVPFQSMDKLTPGADDGVDWDVFLRGPLR